MRIGHRVHTTQKKLIRARQQAHVAPDLTDLHPDLLVKRNVDHLSIQEHVTGVCVSNPPCLLVCILPSGRCTCCMTCCHLLVRRNADHLSIQERVKGACVSNPHCMLVGVLPSGTSLRYMPKSILFCLLQVRPSFWHILKVHAKVNPVLSATGAVCKEWRSVPECYCQTEKLCLMTLILTGHVQTPCPKLGNKHIVPIQCGMEEA